MEKLGTTREKFGTEGRIRSQVTPGGGAGWSWLELARWGRAEWGGPGGDGPGASGPGVGGPGEGRAGQPWREGTCVLIHKNVRRNRVECRFELNS